MKTAMLELLISLFSQQVNQMVGEGAEKVEKADEAPQPSLSVPAEAGSPVDVLKAMLWLESLQKQSQKDNTPASPSAQSFRVYTKSEQSRLGSEGLALLDEMVSQTLLSSADRELVLHQCMILDADEIPVSHLRWIVFMVLATKAKDAEQLVWLDHVVLNDLNSDMTVH